MLKMFQSYQSMWRGAYEDINNVVFDYAKTAPDNRYVDMDFPPIAPDDVAAAAKAIVDIVSVFPNFADSPDVQQIALMTIGVNDPGQVLEELEKEVESNPSLELTQALRKFKEVLRLKE